MGATIFCDIRTITMAENHYFLLISSMSSLASSRLMILITTPELLYSVIDALKQERALPGVLQVGGSAL